MTQAIRRNKLSYLLAGVLLGSCTGATADTVLSSEQKLAAKRAIKSMLLNLQQDPAFADFSITDWDFATIFTGEEITNFGVIVDPNYSEETNDRGLHVLAITPGSAAAAMGIRSGDWLQKIDDINLTGAGKDRSKQSGNFRQLREYISAMPTKATVSLSLLREDRQLTLSGDIEKMVLPAVGVQFRNPADVEQSLPQQDPNGCSTANFKVDPPNNYGFHKVRLISINDDTSGTTFRSVYYLRPGLYTFKLDQLIPDTDSRARSWRGKRPANRPIPSQTMTLALENHYVYHIGAQALPYQDHLGEDQPFWRPVVWRFELGRCKGKPIEK